MPTFNAHKGSWFGLPDIGVTEGIGRLLNRPTTAQGGSNIIGGQRAQTPQSPQVNSGRDSARTIANLGPVKPQGDVLGLITGGSGGGGGGTGGGNQTTGLNLQQVLGAGAPQQAGVDFDAIIAPALQALEGAVPMLQQGFNDYQTSQYAARDNQLASSRQNIGAQEAALEGSRTSQQQNAESAANEARRGFSEIQQGLQARYGGTTGTGAFATEIAGSQTLKNIGQIRQGLSNAMLQIDDKLVQVKEIGRIAEQDINQQTEERIGQARENLNNQILDIRRQQGVLQSEKARMTAESIQQYQNSVNQYKAESQQFMQQLYVQQVNAENQLKAAAQRARTTAESFQVMNLSQGRQMTPVRVGNQGTIQNFSGAPVIPGNDSALYSIGAYKESEDDLESRINSLVGEG